MTVGAAKQTSKDKQNLAPSTFACGVFPEGINHKVRLNRVLDEKDGNIRVTRTRNEQIGDVRYMITGFLKNNCMEPSSGGRNNIGGFLRAGPGFH